MLLERISAEEDEAVLVGDEAPAGARRLAAGLRIRTPDRIDEGPVDEPEQQFPEDDEKNQRQNPIPYPHRSTRALYQFMSAEMLRLMVRYTPMMMTIPSTAWPVWFMVVLTIDTRSG